MGEIRSVKKDMNANIYIENMGFLNKRKVEFQHHYNRGKQQPVAISVDPTPLYSFLILKKKIGKRLEGGKANRRYR